MGTNSHVADVALSFSDTQKTPPSSIAKVDASAAREQILPLKLMLLQLQLVLLSSLRLRSWLQLPTQLLASLAQAEKCVSQDPALQLFAMPESLADTHFDSAPLNARGSNHDVHRSVAVIPGPRALAPKLRRAPGQETNGGCSAFSWLERHLGETQQQ